MTETPSGRRTLHFTNLDQILVEVDLLRAGHHTVGNWSLAQICRHLADSFSGSMDGFGVRNHRVMRFLFGRRALRDALRHGIAPGFTVTDRLTPPADVVLDETVAELVCAVERYKQFIGPMHFHPFFGNLSRAEWDLLHLVHSAHHLSFAVATADARPA